VAGIVLASNLLMCKIPCVPAACGYLFFIQHLICRAPSKDCHLIADAMGDTTLGFVLLSAPTLVGAVCCCDQTASRLLDGAQQAVTRPSFVLVCSLLWATHLCARLEGKKSLLAQHGRAAREFVAASLSSPHTHSIFLHT
jgi:hypothetical protein